MFKEGKEMSKQLKHIAYYTMKVTKEGLRARPSYTGFMNSFRNKRLMAYKRMMNEMLRR